MNSKQSDKKMAFNPHCDLVDAYGNHFPVYIDEIDYSSDDDYEYFRGHTLNTSEHLEAHCVRPHRMEIQRVIHNDPATIVFWADGTKTVVKCQPGDIYDPEKGLAMAISKKALGNQGNYCNVFKKWAPKLDAHKLINDSQQLNSNTPLYAGEAIELSRKGHKLWVQSRGAYLTNGNGWYYGIHNWAFTGYGRHWVAYREKPCCEAED